MKGMSSVKNTLESPKKYNLIFFWKQHDTGIYGRRQEMLVKYFLKSDRVEKILHLEPPLHITDLLKFAIYGLKRKHTHFPLVLKNSLKRLFVKKSDPRLIEYTPFAFVPRFINIRIIRKIQWRVIHWSINRCARKNRMDSNPIILWCCPAHYFIENLAHYVQYSLAIADCIDDNRMWYPLGSPGYKATNDSYRISLSHCDVVFTVSDALTKSLSEFNNNIHWVPNAVEPESELQKITSTESRLHAFSKPRIGYVGNLSTRINASLIKNLAEKKPNWNFILIGSTHSSEKEILQLNNLSNIHFLGPIPYPEVISEIRCLDVALIPHLDNPISRNMDPMKLYLFLGLGIPIVSTRFSGIEKFGEFIHVGNDAESIIHMINKVLNQDSSDLNSWREKVLLFLKDHTWENRVSDIFNAIDNMR